MKSSWKALKEQNQSKRKDQRAHFPPFFSRLFFSRPETWLFLRLRDLWSSEFKTHRVLGLSEVLLASSSIPRREFPRVLIRLFSLIWPNCLPVLLLNARAAIWVDANSTPLPPEESERQKFTNETKPEDEATLKQHVYIYIYIGLYGPGSPRSHFSPPSCTISREQVLY